MLRLAARYADIVNFPDRPPVGVSTAGNPGLGISVPGAAGDPATKPPATASPISS